MTPPSVATAIVGTGSPVSESIGALGRTVIATSLTALFAILIGPVDGPALVLRVVMVRCS